MPRFLEGLAGSRFERAATPATVAVSLRKPLRRPAAVLPAATRKRGALSSNAGPRGGDRREVGRICDGRADNSAATRERPARKKVRTNSTLIPEKSGATNRKGGRFLRLRSDNSGGMEVKNFAVGREPPVRSGKKIRSTDESRSPFRAFSRQLRRAVTKGSHQMNPSSIRSPVAEKGDAGTENAHRVRRTLVAFSAQLPRTSLKSRPPAGAQRCATESESSPTSTPSC